MERTTNIIDSDESNAALKLVAELKAQKEKRIHDEIVSIQRGHGLIGRDFHG